MQFSTKILAKRYGVSERTILRWQDVIGFDVYDPMKVAWYLMQQKSPSRIAMRKTKKQLEHELNP